MKIAAAQIKSLAGDVDGNIAAHILMIEHAVSVVADVILFPELSLTGYEPPLANELATTSADPRFNDFQVLSDNHRITICAGIPIRSQNGVQISMVIFQPHQKLRIYSKQHLHRHEFPFFINGTEQLYFTVDNLKFAPAICYESLVPAHVANAVGDGAQFYLASVAKSASGVMKAFEHYPSIAKQYSIPVIMSNAIGACDNFVSAGQSAIWDNQGSLVGELDSNSEGILLFDTITGQAQMLLNG